MDEDEAQEELRLLVRLIAVETNPEIASLRRTIVRLEHRLAEVEHMLEVGDLRWWAWAPVS